MAKVVAGSSRATCIDGRLYVSRQQQRLPALGHSRWPCPSKQSHPAPQHPGWPDRINVTGLSPASRLHPRTVAFSGLGSAEPNGSQASGKEETLQQLVQLFRNDQLAQLPEDHHLHPYSIGMDFLFWLSDREHSATGDEQRELGALAAALVAMREGLRPLNTAEYAAAASSALEPASGGSGQLAELHTSPRYGNLSEAEIDEIARRRAALALSPAGMALANRQVAELKGGVAEARARSAVELMGRVQLPNDDAGLSAAAATDRILDFLLDVEDAAEVAALLPDAFTPPDTPDQGEGDEMLSTTPLRLLNAVDARISMVAQAAEQGGISDVEQSMQRLNSLREQVSQCLEF